MDDTIPANYGQQIEDAFNKIKPDIELMEYPQQVVTLGVSIILSIIYTISKQTSKEMVLMVIKDTLDEIDTKAKLILADQDSGSC